MSHLKGKQIEHLSQRPRPEDTSTAELTLHRNGRFHFHRGRREEDFFETTAKKSENCKCTLARSSRLPEEQWQFGASLCRRRTQSSIPQMGARSCRSNHRDRIASAAINQFRTLDRVTLFLEMQFRSLVLHP